jgi:hypothetical protein
MRKIVKETVTTEPEEVALVTPTPVKVAASDTQTAEYLIDYVLGAVEVLLAFRLILKLAGASLASAFVKAIYGLTNVLIWPFEGIFRRGFAQGVETTAVLEPATIVALIVYPILALGIIKFIRISSGEAQVE